MSWALTMSVAYDVASRESLKGKAKKGGRVQSTIFPQIAKLWGSYFK